MAAVLSGQKIVTTAGTAVVLGSQQVLGSLMVKALSTNTGVIAIGNDGADDVTVSNGLILEAGDAVVYVGLSSMSRLWLDSSVNGEGVSWTVLDL